MIHKIEQFISDEHPGVTIMRWTPQPDRSKAFPEAPVTQTAFHAAGLLNTPHGPRQFDVPIIAATIEEAFRNFPSAAEAASKRADREYQAAVAAAERQLVLPSGQRLPPLGRPNSQRRERFQAESR